MLYGLCGGAREDCMCCRVLCFISDQIGVAKWLGRTQEIGACKVVVKGFDDERCLLGDHLINKTEFENLIECRVSSAILVSLGSILLPMMRKLREWVLLSEGITVIPEEVGLQNGKLNVTVRVDLLF